MHFAPDSEASLGFAVALANTDSSSTRSGEDELTTPMQLTALLDLHRYSGRFDRDDAELHDVRAARGDIRRLWSLGRDEIAGEANRMLRDARALPYLIRHDDFDWHLHATEQNAPLAERMRAEVALALIDLVRSDETGRLRRCGAGDCGGIFVDFSRNGSKRFCSVRCGNRMNMVAFRERTVSDGVATQWLADQ